MVARVLVTPNGNGKFETALGRKVWKVFVSLFTIAFLSELVLRFAVCDAIGAPTAIPRIEFVKQPMNIVDFLSCLPYFVEGSDIAESHSIFAKTARLLRIS